MLLVEIKLQRSLELSILFYQFMLRINFCLIIIKLINVGLL